MALDFSLVKKLSQKTNSKIVFLVLDGLGGLPFGEKGLSELEGAQVPEFDELACKSSLGLVDTVHPGITPGSGPGHLGLFGYDPLKFNVGRGVLASLGVNFELQPSDIAARINFCTLDDQGNVTDRRAGRISTEECKKRVDLLQGMSFEGVECFVTPVIDYRAALILRGKGLNGKIEDTDPQKTGVPPLPVIPESPEAEFTARVTTLFLAEAQKRIASHLPANGILLRGFDSYHPIETITDIFHLKGGSIAVYPMYKGVSRLVGMDVLDTGPTIEDEITCLEKHFSDYDYFYIHIKKSDSYGEDGNYDGKVGIIEQVSRQIPRILKLKPDTLAITGDHSTPASFRAHSWHPVPLLIHSANLRYRQQRFTEKDCANGDLGRIRGRDLMLLLLANSGKLKKFGA